MCTGGADIMALAKRGAIAIAIAIYLHPMVHIQ
jgi:hypothetical protein